MERKLIKNTTLRGELRNVHKISVGKLERKRGETGWLILKLYR
jgi:hypothetical protein